jgi:hypothetical protein
MNIEQTASTPAVTGAIRQASRATGADFKYLLATAQVESNFLRAPTLRCSMTSHPSLASFWKR